MKNVVELLRPSQRTQNLAILLSDMKGFTARTSRQTREENFRMLAFHDALLLPVIRGFGGRKVKSIGDALLRVHAWDEAFALAQQQDSKELILQLQVT